MPAPTSLRSAPYILATTVPGSGRGVRVAGRAGLHVAQFRDDQRDVVAQGLRAAELALAREDLRGQGVGGAGPVRLQARRQALRAVPLADLVAGLDQAVGVEAEPVAGGELHRLLAVLLAG